MSHNNTVFLGGTCNGSKWRDVAARLLYEAGGIKFFNPVVDEWNHEAQEREIRYRKECMFCLYVITPEMLGTYSIAEVVDDSNKRPEKTIFVPLRKHGGFTFKDSEWKSLLQVAQMVKDNTVNVFDTIEDACNYISNSRK